MGHDKKESYGAYLYTYDKNGTPGFIFGSELVPMLNKPMFYPFKGGKLHEHELPIDAAIREVSEETNDLVVLDKNTFKLDTKVSTHHKTYTFGLARVPYSIIDDYNSALYNNEITQESHKAKLELKFFSFTSILYDSVKLPFFVKKVGREYILELKKLGVLKYLN